MTLCIGAIASDKKIILMTDGMLSLDYMSVDTRTMKVTPVSMTWRYWLAFAGVPSYAEAISRFAGRLVDATDYTIEAVTKACERGFQAVRQKAIETQVLSTFKMNYDTFLRDGLRTFGEKKFGEIAREMQQVTLGTDILVAGHDPKQRPHLFSVSDPGEATSHQVPGFYAIGSGNVTALGSLFSTRDQRSDMTWVDLAYRVLEAKFLGESALGVGSITNGLLLSPDGSIPRTINNAPCAQVREIWREQGRPPMPKNAGVVIENRFVPVPWIRPGDS